MSRGLHIPYRSCAFIQSLHRPSSIPLQQHATSAQKQAPSRRFCCPRRYSPEKQGDTRGCHVQHQASYQQLTAVRLRRGPHARIVRPVRCRPRPMSLTVSTVRPVGRGCHHRACPRARAQHRLRRSLCLGVGRFLRPRVDAGAQKHLLYVLHSEEAGVHVCHEHRDSWPLILRLGRRQHAGGFTRAPAP